MRAISLKFVSSQKGNYLEERLYGKIFTWVLESIIKSWPCQTIAKKIQIELPGIRGPKSSGKSCNMVPLTYQEQQAYLSTMEN